MPSEGDLRVWWIPQVPGKPFRVDVKNLGEAKLLLRTMANYDLFQPKNRIKPDFCNAGGLEIYHRDQEDGDQDWCEWEDEEGNNIDYVLRRDRNDR